MASRIVRRSTVAPRSTHRTVEGIGKSMRAALSETLRNVMLTAADAVEAACPIRTGHLLSNFILSTGSPHQGVVGSPEAVDYSAQDAGREKILAYEVGRDGKIYITNHVEYLKYQRPFVTEALMSGAAAAPRGMRGRARKALKAMARASFKRGA
jgi:hypothetical protein